MNLLAGPGGAYLSFWHPEDRSRGREEFKASLSCTLWPCFKQNSIISKLLKIKNRNN